MSLKPLYLDPGRRWHVHLDGPALRLETEGRAATRVPLRRLARVVSPQDAHWHATALVGCLRSGVTVVFADHSGAVQGWCFGPRRRETTLTGLLAECLGQIDGAGVLDDWLRHARGRQIATALTELRVPHDRVDPRDARGRLCNRHRQRIGFGVGNVLSALELASAAFAAQHLHAAVADPSLVGYAREGVNLARSFTELLHWDLHRILHRTPVWRLLDTEPQRLAPQLMEEHGALLARSLGALLGDLERRLREWLL